MVRFCEILFFQDSKHYHWASIILDGTLTIDDVIKKMDWDIPLHLEVGIHSVKKSRNTLLKHMDRIEIYHPLVCSPNEIRKRRQLQHQF